MHHPLAKFSLVRAGGARAQPGMILLASNTFSAVSTVDLVLTAYTAYRALKLFVTCSGNGSGIGLRFSTDAGSSYFSSLYEYTRVRFGDTSPWDQDGATSTSTAIMGDAGTNANSYTGEWTLFDQTKASGGSTHAWGNVDYDGEQGISYASTHHTDLNDVDAIRLLPTTGTITGSYSLYGLV